MGEGPSNWRHAFRTLLTWSPIVALFGVAGLVIAPAVGGVLPVQSIASATVGLTSESDWPFHEANLLQIAGALDDDVLLRQAEANLGFEPGTGTVDENTESFASQSVIRLRVGADNAADAAALVNELAELAIASRPDVPVQLIDRAESPTGSDRPVLAATGLMLGLLAGLAAIPALDRGLGRVVRTDHPEFAGRVRRWVDLRSDDGLLPVPDDDDRLTMPMRYLEGPIVVLGVDTDDGATAVAKTMSRELATEVVDGGDVHGADAAAALRDCGAVVLVVEGRKVRRRALDAVVHRLDTLGTPVPTVVLRSPS